LPPTNLPEPVSELVGRDDVLGNTIIAKGTDWRFLNELKRELKT
jgi:hypothetical protein